MCKRRSDQLPVETLLHKTEMKPVNCIAAEMMLLEMWKAKHFEVSDITSAYSTNSGHRHKTKLRTSKDPGSFISKSATLWNQMSEEFRMGSTNIKAAKNEIRSFVKTLPW